MNEYHFLHNPQHNPACKIDLEEVPLNPIYGIFLPILMFCGCLEFVGSFFFFSFFFYGLFLLIRPINLKAQILDVSVSLAKVADVDRSLGSEDVAVEGFREGIKLLESLKLKPEERSLEQRVS